MKGCLIHPFDKSSRACKLNLTRKVIGEFMKVQATRVMANALNKGAREHGKAYAFRHITVTPQEYERYIDSDLFTAEDYGDYNASTGKLRAIKVVYPDEYYAMPRYLTTRALNREFVSGDTAESYIKRVLESVEI